MKKQKTQGTQDVSQDNVRFLSQSQLAVRWNCSHTSVQRIAERSGIARYLLGEGKNGMVRYRLDEIEAYEKARCVGSSGQ